MSQEPEPIITYFRPGQLIFHVKGNLHDDPTKIEAMLKWANENEFAKSKGISLSPLTEALDFTPEPNRLVTTQQKEVQYEGLSYKSPPAKLPEPFSLVGVNVKSQKWPPFPTNKKEHEEALDELLELAIDLNKYRATGDKNLVAVSPNWLMSGGPSTPGSTGGPGGRPSPYEGPGDTGHFDLDFLQAIPNESLRGELDGNVVVAILDTAPKLREDENEEKALNRIHDEWANKHSLIASLLGSNRKLKKVYPDATVDQPIPGVRQVGGPQDQDWYIEVEGHDYEMTDHGLFAAGIIHSIAPQAELYLFQVLNRYGVGDLLSIARAMKTIHDDNITFPKNRLVVNLSLTINIPIEEAHGKGGKTSADIRAKILKIKGDKVTDMGTVQTIEWICDSLYAQGAKVIAAAGNNGALNHRPQACYPAAFAKVLGVGALPISEKPKTPQEKVKTAKYSNRSDRPEWTGITTLGGEEGKEKGVLVIYVEKFPNDEKGNPQDNTSGWAWWAGTSFATPIITGLTAAVRSVMPTEKTVEDSVVELLKAQPYKTEGFNEDVLWVEQRP